MRRISAGLVLIGVLLAGGAPAQQRQQQQIDLQAAIRKETVDGDLNGALKQYAAIVAKYGKTDRAVAAAALVHMAECHSKMGDADAKKIYEQVVREYGDQKDAVATARARLGGTPGQPSSRLVWSGTATLSGVSYDGRYLSFVDRPSGDLVVREIATGTVRRLTSKPKGSKEHVDVSTISRDSRQVAYDWDKGNGYEIWLANVAGDPAPRRLYENADISEIHPQDWSPDGKWLAVEFYKKDKSAYIGLLSIADGSLKVLKPVDKRGPGKIVFSPDGKHLGYDLAVGDTKDRRDIFILRIDGAVETPTPSHHGQDEMAGWSPDGTRLLFTRRLTDSVALWALPFADGKTSGTAELIKPDIGHAAIGVTRAGAVYYGLTQNVDGYDFWSVRLASVDFDAGKFLSAPIEVDNAQNGLGPHWSPDGKYLAYTSISKPSSATRSIVIRSADTGQIVRSLTVKLWFQETRWAPDGQSFVVGAFDASAGRSGVYKIDAQTGEISTLFLDQPGEGSASPVWSPDGKSLYVMRQSKGTTRFVRREIASGNEREIAHGNFGGVTNLSPDGRYLAAASVDRSTNSRAMWLIPTDGDEARVVMRVAFEGDPADLGNGRQMLRDGPGIIGVLWAPDSRSFLTMKRLAGGKENDEVWRVPVNGDAPRKLEFRMDRRIAPAMSLHPDGHRLAYTINETGAWQDPRQEIWLLENFLPAKSAGK